MTKGVISKLIVLFALFILLAIPLSKSQTSCSLSISLNTMSDAYIGDDIKSFITLTNTGDLDGYVRLKAYLCRVDGSYDYHCHEMFCGSYTDPAINLYGDSSTTVVCNREAKYSGEFRIKVDYSGCNIDPTIYSNVFTVNPYKRCPLTYLDSFRCFGNYLDQQLQLPDCSTKWDEIKYCEYGCDADKCIEPNGIPQISLDPIYKVEKCTDSLIIFSVQNAGTKDKFTLSASGEAAGWMSTGSDITLDKGEKKTVMSRIYVPCDAKNDEYSLSMMASNKISDSDSAVVRVEGGTDWTALEVVLVVAAFVVVIFFAAKVPIFKNRNLPESF